MEDGSDPTLAAEALLAVSGIFPAGPLTRADGKLAAAIPKQWKREVEAWLDQKSPRPFKAAKLPDIEALLDDLEPQEGDELITELENADIATDYLIRLNQARQYIDQQIPRYAQDTPLGRKSLPLGKLERSRIGAVLSVVDDPARIVAELRSGSLTSAQADAFKTCYPGLFDLLKRAIWDALVARFKTAEKYALPYGKERVLRTLVGVPTEVSLAQEKPEKSQGPSQGLPKIDFRDRLATKAQKLESDSR